MIGCLGVVHSARMLLDTNSIMHSLLQAFVATAGAQQMATGGWHLVDAFAAEARPSAAQQSPYWVSNETGASVAFWLAASAHGAPTSAPGGTRVPCQDFM